MIEYGLLSKTKDTERREGEEAMWEWVVYAMFALLGTLVVDGLRACDDDVKKEAGFGRFVIGLIGLVAAVFFTLGMGSWLPSLSWLSGILIYFASRGIASLGKLSVHGLLGSVNDARDGFQQSRVNRRKEREAKEAMEGRSAENILNRFDVSIAAASTALTRSDMEENVMAFARGVGGLRELLQEFLKRRDMLDQRLTGDDSVDTVAKSVDTIDPALLVSYASSDIEQARRTYAELKKLREKIGGVIERIVFRAETLPNTIALAITQAKSDIIEEMEQDIRSFGDILSETQLPPDLVEMENGTLQAKLREAVLGAEPTPIASPSVRIS